MEWSSRSILRSWNPAAVSVLSIQCLLDFCHLQRKLAENDSVGCLSILDSNIVEYRSKLWLPCSPNLPGQRQSSFTSARCFSECRHADAIQRCRNAGKRAGRGAAAEKKGGMSWNGVVKAERSERVRRLGRERSERSRRMAWRQGQQKQASAETWGHTCWK